MSEKELFIGQSAIKDEQRKVNGKYVTIDGEEFFQIENCDSMDPFFMTIVSGSNHWMFISSNGALSAGRRNPESALFPYYTDDKITDSAEITGSKSIFKVSRGDKRFLWEPFSDRNLGVYSIQRNIYKNRIGNKIILEEINNDLEVAFRYSWTFSNKYGFVKKSTIDNSSNSSVEIELLDGIQNLMPYGVGSGLQNQRSTLVDAYKKNELDQKTGLGQFMLSAMIVDKAEPSEALECTSVWAAGIEVDRYLLSSQQLVRFRKGKSLNSETDVRAERGAYFVNTTISLSSGASKDWYIVGDVGQSIADLISIDKLLGDQHSLLEDLKLDIAESSEQLLRLVAKADGLQLTSDKISTGRHLSNVLFNIMRGGIFEDNYEIDKSDLSDFMETMNRPAFNEFQSILEQLPAKVQYSAILRQTELRGNMDLQRLCFEYLPLSFSRRHGDPSRPWNMFSIDLEDEEGNKTKNFEGNWRDIFQNWEALAMAFPGFLDSMIAKFVNASTIDGYNPYRITRDGIDWETIEEDNPWSFIGYWGDHQIIYLLKLLELSEKHHPGRLGQLLTRPANVYANVPYRIKGYEEILENPNDTIVFDHDVARSIDEKVDQIGADGKLVFGHEGELLRANLAEKILVTTLTKLYNFIPEAGIWLNTQRPEWNDANNALVGNGVSMVTLYYLRRFLLFGIRLFKGIDDQEIVLNNAVSILLVDIKNCFDEEHHLLTNSISDQDRKRIVENLGRAGEKYRASAYSGFRDEPTTVMPAEVITLFGVALDFVDHSIRANARPDGLYHAYNIIEATEGAVGVNELYEMLEGQVAVLTSQYLKPDESLALLDQLKKSKLYREDQYSYLLYPNRELPTFLKKNTLPREFASNSKLVSALHKHGDRSLVVQDVSGEFHFNASFHNAEDLKNRLDHLENSEFVEIVVDEREAFIAVFEEMFDHKSFTGRSGTFYGYEGLGSIYWHMVSKLLLAVQETIISAKEEGYPEETIGRLVEHYYEIRAGIGANKSPDLYGAFPTDAYSHTPGNAGAQQPGMTGQVKEDIINRWAELGVAVVDGQLSFNPFFLRKKEFLDSSQNFEFYNVIGTKKKITISENSLAFTYCQVPIIYSFGPEGKIVLTKEGMEYEQEGNELDAESTAEILARSGKIELLHIIQKE